MIKGRIHSFQSLGTLDGPGVRFIIFTQGCPLRCCYCHNPDTWDFSGGTEVSADEAVAKAKKYKGYFGKNGGVTVSGGEPLAQAGFVKEIFRLCKNEGLHTVLDTSGYVLNEEANENVEELLEYTDMCLLDYKFTTDEDYVKYAGANRRNVLNFLEKLNEKCIRTWIRQVIFPGVNDSEEALKNTSMLAEAFECVEKIEYLPLNKLCCERSGSTRPLCESE